MAQYIEIVNRDDVAPLLNETPPNESIHEEGEEEMVHLIQINETDDGNTNEADGEASPEVIETSPDHDSENLPAESCIFRVHDGLRKANPDAYTPMLISIGPYHWNNTKLKAMEVNKHKYLQSFVERGRGSVESYKETLKGMEKIALEFYADPIDLNSDEFVSMLLLDGSFIVEFVRRCSESGPKARDDPFFNVGWMQYQACRDLLLFENQLPYFVLSELYDLTKDPAETEFSFNEIVKWTFSSMLPKLLPISIFVDGDETREIKHLLHVVHILCHPLNDEGSSEGNIVNSSELLDQMRSVTELQEAGVSFKKVGKIYSDIDEHNLSDNVSLFDIKFSEGEIKIPSFKVDDDTESFFRNLIAYEQHSLNVHPKYFSDYASIMDQLINSSNDVSILRLEGIVMNLLGDDKVVARLFNKLGEGVITSSSFYYSGVCNKVNQHCQKPWNVIMAKLRHDYFNSPWAGISTGAAIVLLLLTVAQTVATLINI